MSKIDQLVKTIVKAIDEKDRKKTRALDTVATVSRVDGDTAWVTFAGSDQETPVKQTISVKKGDKIHVRASKGKAWIVGNETAPPTDDTLAKKAMSQANKAGQTAKRASDLTIVNDTLYYLASDQEEGVTVGDESWTKEPQEVTESLPYLWAYHDYERGNGTHFKSDPVIIAMYAESGVGVVSVETYYYVSTSQYQPIGGSWGTTYNYISGTYIWRKELITHDDGTTTWTTALYDSGLTQSLELAYDTAQYIWTQTSTSDTNIPTGQYVTEYPKAQYTNQNHTNYCKGGSLLLRSAVLYLRQGVNKLVELVQAGLKIYEPTDSTNPVAQFLSSGAIIGKENDFHTTIQPTYGMSFWNGGTLCTQIAPITNSRGIALTSQSDRARVDITSNAGTYSGEFEVSINDAAGYSGISVGGGTVNIGAVSGAFFNSTDVNVGGKLTAGAINSDLFDVSTESVSTDSGTGNRTGTARATKSGYYPLAIAGLSVATGGCYSRGAYLTSQASGSCTVNFRAYNGSGTSQAVNATAYVLWVKTTA